MSYDDPDDLSYNPFAEQDDHQSSHSGESTNLAQGFYSSAYFPKVPQSPPSLRRRKSTSTDHGNSKAHGSRGKRSHTRTEIQVKVPHSAGLHPLKSALAKIDSSAEDLGITRPGLSRVMNEGGLGEASASERDVNTLRSPTPPEEEKEVIIHQISPKDSLPGVSLKYGISMADLRRANQLWTSDSIHRREVLYIPIDQASRAREYIPDPNLIIFSPDEQTSPPATPPRATSASASERENSELVPRSPSAPVRRMPVKQLSYFPPSLHKSASSSLVGDSSTSSPLPAGGSKLSPNRYNSSPASNSFASILTALPIAASTRDELITRLSFDSVSSSFSDRSRTSRYNSDEDDGHELNEVKRPSPLDMDNDDTCDEFSMPTPKASQRVSHALPSGKKSSPPLARSQSHTTPQRSHASMLPPQFYVSQASETYVRTSQLEPSPAMKIPSFSSRTVGRSAGKAVQEDARLERTSSLTLGRESRMHTTNDRGLALDNLKIGAPP